MGTKAAGATRMFPIGIDYGRFSGRRQEEGTSEERQTSLADAWSKRTGIPIDLRLLDEATSGFKNQADRLNKDDVYALALFLKLIGSRVQPGDYLLLDNFDRLSRDKEVRATNLLTNILCAGVKVVQLAPYELELTEDSDMFSIFRAVMELSRGHGESARKRQTVGASYALNRIAAVEGRECYQGSLPSWLIRIGDGAKAKQRRIVKDEERCAIVRLIYQWAADGLGSGKIVKRLVAEGREPFGARQPLLDKEGNQKRSRTGRLRWKGLDRWGTGQWTRSYVQDILRGRAAVGELVTKTGEVVRVPAAVTEEEWAAAQAGLQERKRNKGREKADGVVNLWQGLLTEVTTGEHLYSVSRRGDGGASRRVLLNAGGADGGSEMVSFPEPVFEEALLRCLQEVEVSQVTGQGGGPDPVAVITGRLEKVREQITETTAEMDAGQVRPKAALALLSKWEAEEAALEEERRQIEQAAKHPLSETWGQAKSLLEVVKTAEDRLRLRSLLRRMVEDVRVLIVPRGWDRVAAVQMRFSNSSEVRNIIITFRRDVMPSGVRASRRRRERGQDVYAFGSLRHERRLDLRDPAHVAALRAELQAADLAVLQAELLRGHQAAP